MTGGSFSLKVGFSGKGPVLSRLIQRFTDGISQKHEWQDCQPYDFLRHDKGENYFEIINMHPLNNFPIKKAIRFLALAMLIDDILKRRVKISPRDSSHVCSLFLKYTFEIFTLCIIRDINFNIVILIIDSARCLISMISYQKL